MIDGVGLGSVVRLRSTGAVGEVTCLAVYQYDTPQCTVQGVDDSGAPWTVHAPVPGVQVVPPEPVAEASAAGYGDGMGGKESA